MKSILLSIALIVCLGGCYTDKKAQKQVGKALALKPQLVAKIARDAFPCTTLHLDTTVISTDSIVYIECPDAVTPAADYFGSVTGIWDTVISHPPAMASEKNTSQITKYIRVPVSIPVKQIIITKAIEDSAKIKLISYELQQVQKEKAELNVKMAARNKLITWLLVFLAGLSIPYIIKLVKLF